MKLFFLILFFPLFSYSQTSYPKDYFVSPLDIPLQLSGNFGELRPNHFHSGFDFKTLQREGLNVKAAAEGYVSRIKISESGYGKAIYITHPNGFTTVYGHLQSGYGKIEKKIKELQYKSQSYEIDVLLEPNELIVEKAEQIAISGNTGGSDGPHLHFEIRDTQSEKIINPLFFGFDTVIVDTKQPNVTSLIVYPLTDSTKVNQSKIPISLGLYQQKDGSYLAEKVGASGKIGFGIISTDFDNVSWNANGIYKAEVSIDGMKTFGYTFNTFSFDETRLVNALIDYERYKKLKQRVQRLFMQKVFPLSIVNSYQSNGIIDVSPAFRKNILLEVSDFNGNISKINIPVEYSNEVVVVDAPKPKSKYYIKSGREAIFSKENVSVSFPENTFYQDFEMNFDVKDSVLQLHEDTVPAFKNFAITFVDSTSSADDKKFIAYYNGKKWTYCTTKYANYTFTTYQKTLGRYQLMKDITCPKISITKEINGKWISEQKDLKFIISDDLSGIKTYNGYLNGKWILLEYESKTKTLKHSFLDGIVDEGKNDLKVIVTDNVGNSTIFETQFFRSQKTLNK
ncbi:MAG: M23 family metallopeptidase [Flavobacteriaceae bacterium]